jgi:hypothetical protein
LFYCEEGPLAVRAVVPRAPTDSAGTTKLAQTADLSTVFASSGEKVMALITPYVMAAAGYVKVLLWSVFGGTSPNLARAVQVNLRDGSGWAVRSELPVIDR